MERVWGVNELYLSFRALWKNKGFIIATTIFTTLLGVMFIQGKSYTDSYKATVLVCIQNDLDTQNQAVLSDYVSLVNSEQVCQRAAAQLPSTMQISKNDISNMVTIGQSSDVLLSITAVNENPEACVAIANAAASAFVQVANTNLGESTVRVFDEASEYQIDSKGSDRRNIIFLAFIFAGVMSSSGYIFISDIFSKRLRCVQYCEENSPNEIFGVVPMVKRDIRKQGE